MSEATKQEPVILCYHCGNLGKSLLVTSHLNPAGLAYAIPGDEDSGSVAVEELFELHRCGACKKISVRCTTYFTDPRGEDYEHYFEYEVKAEVLYPAPVSLPLGVPVAVARSYSVAAKVEKVDAEAYGMLMRNVLEEVCLDRGIRGRNLQDKLGHLAKQEGLPKAMQDIGGYLRLLGNLGTHPEEARLTTSEVPIIGALCRAILLYVYTPPHLAKMAEDSYRRVKGGTQKGDAQGIQTPDPVPPGDALASLFEAAGKRIAVRTEPEVSSAPCVVVLTGDAEADKKRVADAKAKRAEDERRLGHSITLIVIDP